MTAGTAVQNILYGILQRIYSVLFGELSWSVWDKCRLDDGIMKFSQILGQFITKFSGDYFEFGAWSDTCRSEL
jgi:hypothetical protein